MLYKEDIEKVLMEEIYSPIRDGDILTALGSLYNQLPYKEWDTYNKIEIPDDKPVGEVSNKTVNFNTLRELQELADELNEAEPINWNDDSQIKVYIEYNCAANKLMQSFSYVSKDLNIYSTDERFLEIAKERIGEEKLIKLFKEGI